MDSEEMMPERDEHGRFIKGHPKHGGRMAKVKTQAKAETPDELRQHRLRAKQWAEYEEKIIGEMITRLEVSEPAQRSAIFKEYLTMDLPGQTKERIQKHRKQYALAPEKGSESTTTRNSEWTQVIDPKVLPKVVDSLKKLGINPGIHAHEANVEPEDVGSYIPPLQSTQNHDLAQRRVRKNERSSLEHSPLRADHKSDTSPILPEDMP
ncbi:MAG: hypothetical protein JNM27_13720, partial [Leptospirales bacterium]|nr:hypothetical protein [Leptospirales bacterium]